MKNFDEGYEIDGYGTAKRIMGWMSDNGNLGRFGRYSERDERSFFLIQLSASSDLIKSRPFHVLSP
jgi:hypothetical protein